MPLLTQPFGLFGISYRKINLLIQRVLTVVLLIGVLGISATGSAKEWKSGIVWPEPVVVEPGEVGGPPSDAIVLFGGTSLDAWHGGNRWIVKDGVATAKRGGLTSKQSFGDCQLHVEWSAPEKVEGRGQGRGNSGLYFMQKYEVQILDSYKNPTYFDGQASAIYKQTPPMVNAMRKPGEWNVYDVLFTAPRFNDDGSLKSPTYITLIHNGIVVQNHFELEGKTDWDAPPKYTKHEEKLPLGIQFHGDPVRFRNIWIREIQAIVGVAPGAKQAEKTETGGE